MSADVIPITPRFDPGSSDAEHRYDGIVARLNRLIALRHRVRRDCAELERQFVDDDLRVASGSRRGHSLTRRGRRQRLELLLDKTAELGSLNAEWTRLNAELDRMNRALDDWTREHWGMGGSRGVDEG